MTSSNLLEVLNRLPKLAPEECAQVRQRLAFLAPETTVPLPTDKEDWLLEGLTQELRRRGLWMRAYPIPKKLLPEGFAEKSQAARAYLEKGAPGMKRREERVALAGMAAQVLVDYMVELKVPVSPKTLLNFAAQVPSAMERAFPGYWTNGLLGFLVRRF